MASSVTREPENNRKKRKKNKPESIQKHNKRTQVNPLMDEEPEALRKDEQAASSSMESQGSMGWKSLDLALLLQNKELPLQRKIELAYEFVGCVDIELEKASGCVQIPHLISFMSDWIQGVLISSEKKNLMTKTANNSNNSSESSDAVEPCLDFRCWTVFKWCLNFGQVEHLNISPHLMRSITYVLKEALIYSDDICLRKETQLDGTKLSLYDHLEQFSESLLLLFPLHGRRFNANMELWASSSLAAADLVQKVFTISCSKYEGDCLLKISSLVLESFASFMASHPNPRNLFQVFVEKLLEPLMTLIPVLRTSTKESLCGDIKYEWTSSLLEIVEHVLSSGIFHFAHLDGFLGLHNLTKSLGSPGVTKESKNDDFVTRKQEGEALKAVSKSYHKCLFQKLMQLKTERKNQALVGLGLLLSLFICQVKKQCRDVKQSISTKSDNVHMDTNLKHHPSIITYASSDNKALENYTTLYVKSTSSRGLNEATRKSVFDLFREFVRPLLLDIQKCSDRSLEEENIEFVILHAHCILQSINELLAQVMHEKIYIPTEDTPQKENYSFLKEVYDVLLRFYAQIPAIWTWVIKNISSSQNGLLSVGSQSINLEEHIKTLIMLIKEAVTAIGYFLDIEYKVVEDDLIDIWSMMLTYLALDSSLCDAFPHGMFSHEIVRVGCLLIKVYSELRQVGSPIFSLCKAIRCIGSPRGDRLMGDFDKEILSCVSSLSFDTCVGPVITLLCSQEFRDSITNAIKSIPEGQASGCIRLLKMDVSESLAWIKKPNNFVGVGNEIEDKALQNNDSKGRIAQAEVLGRGLSEVYTLILDNLTVITSNSVLVGNSLKELVATICPCLSNLVGLQPDRIAEFLSAVSDVWVPENDILKCKLFLSWILVFFFRIYTSSRSLYRQSICLMPPTLARKASVLMGDIFTAYSGMDWKNRINPKEEGYFSLIRKPSDPLLVILQSISDYFQWDSYAQCPQLLYLLHVMTLQRLVDLNWQIKSFEFLQERDERINQAGLLDSAAESAKKWERHASLSKKEASDLTCFVLEFLSSSLFSKAKHKFLKDDLIIQYNAWNLSVGSMSNNVLPCAIWWLLCQNVDIWCTHAMPRNLKKFMTLLVHNSLSYLNGDARDSRMQNVDHTSCTRIMTMCDVSWELLNDTILYEQPLLCRHLRLRLCHALKKSLPPRFFDPYIDLGFDNVPDWQELIDRVEKVSTTGSGDLAAPHAKGRTRNESDPSFREGFIDCQHLLHLMCWIPKSCTNSKSFSVYATHILNIERVVVFCLLDHVKLTPSKSYWGESRVHIVVDELFKLLLSSRRALKYLAVSSEQIGQSSFVHIIFQNSFSILWVLKSISEVSALSLMFTDEDNASRHMKRIIFALIFHTSQLFSTLCKGQMNLALQSLKSQEPLNLSVPVHHVVNTSEKLLKPDEHPQNTTGHSQKTKTVEIPNSDPWERMELLAETLKEHAIKLCTTLEEETSGTSFRAHDINVVLWTRLSSLAAGIQGFVWGFVSAINSIKGKYSIDKTQLFIWRHSHVSRVMSSVNVFEQFAVLCIKMFLLDNSRRIKTDSDCLGNWGSTNQVLQSDYGSGPTYSQVKEFTIDLFELPDLTKSLLQTLLKGKNPDLAFCIGQLFMVAAAILKVKHVLSFPMVVNQPMNFCQSMDFLIGLMHYLLSESTSMVGWSHPSSFSWLHGVLKYLEVLGSCLPFKDPIFSRDVYAKLINLHLGVIEKFISLQGRTATLAYHKTGYNFEKLEEWRGPSEDDASEFDSEKYNMNEFKARIKTSFTMFVRNPLELHFLSAIQAVERALVGVQEGCTMVYEIKTGGIKGGKVAAVVASGIECLDLILECITGRKCMNVLARHIPSLAGALFNIVLHLQSPLIFLPQKLEFDPNQGYVDPGSVILMCVGVLSKVAAKDSLCPLFAGHVGQCLHLPTALFQHFSWIKKPQDSFISPLFTTNPGFGPKDSLVMNGHLKTIDYVFCVNLYTACCRLLCTVIRHWKREVGHCISLLCNSVRILLYCLETMDTDLAHNRGFCVWNTQEVVKCASFLRRIYEEIRQQKEPLGMYSSHFLSSYIQLYSGLGPSKMGIKREVDEALRPGIYALIDICSPDDLQHLHTVLGEGPCRSTLQELRHEHELRFKYFGKA
ncbi:hypothetical protein AMTRI_Chr09g40570 [Amborella trichopoda]